MLLLGLLVELLLDLGGGVLEGVVLAGRDRVDLEGVGGDRGLDRALDLALGCVEDVGR